MPPPFKSFPLVRRLQHLVFVFVPRRFFRAATARERGRNAAKSLAYACGSGKFNTEDRVMENQDARVQAEKAVKAKIGLYIHILVYVLVNAGLAAINLSTSPDKIWFIWPLFGWGI